MIKLLADERGQVDDWPAACVCVCQRACIITVEPKTPEMEDGCFYTAVGCSVVEASFPLLQTCTDAESG